VGAVRLQAVELAERRREPQRTVKPPGEPVEAAPELAAPAVVVLQRAAAVQAGVDEGLDPVAGAHDDVAVTGDVVDDVAAYLGQVLLAAGHLPHLAPQVFLLLLVPGAGGVALDRDPGIARGVVP